MIEPLLYEFILNAVRVARSSSTPPARKSHGD
jgi:hypothetical protein